MHIFQNIWVHGNSEDNRRLTEASQMCHGGTTEVVEAVEVPAEMAGRGVAETVEDVGEADQEGGKPVAARATENRRKMCREGGNGREMEAG
jgi:hypothetical protein